MRKNAKAVPMIKKFVASIVVVLPLLLVDSLANAQSYNADGSNKATTGKSPRTVILSSDDTGVEQELILRQQQRMDLFDTDLKDLRGSVEQGFRTLQMQVEQLSSSTSTDESEISASIRSLQDNIERLTDALAMTNRRMERTLEITSDVEFRLLRMEKRMQTLMTLGGNDLANAAVAADTLPGGSDEQITMQRNAGDGTTTWSVDEKKLNQQLDEGDPTIAAAPKTGVGDAIDATGRLDANGAAQETSEGTVETSTAEEASVLPAKPEILPDESPDEQYRFALGKALQNDLETAENAFAEFRLFNKGHSREADAAFWLGRVQFMRGSYEKAAMTFSEFNSEYPNDARLVDTTMWIAESVSHFAPQDQACAIYASLPSLLDSPPESFTTQLAKLSAASNCDS
jgi:TolA-binding protein